MQYVTEIKCLDCGKVIATQYGINKDDEKTLKARCLPCHEATLNVQ